MRVVILASGRGSNAEAIFKASASGKLPRAEIAALISDKPDAPALAKAREHGIKALYIAPECGGAKFSESGAKAYIDTLRGLGVNLIVLAGFMRILPREFIAAFPNAIINLHPSLLPAFKGKDAIKQAFEYGVKICGCTVHYVSEDVDGGKIIAQKTVEILPEDTLETLTQKVHAAEHKLLPEVIRTISEGR